MLSVKRTEYLRGRAFEEVVVATTPTTHVTFPAGLPRLATGQYYASPALADLVAKYPHDELGDRLGTMKGVLPRAALKGPDQVIAMVAEDWGQLSADPNARVQPGFPDKGPHATSFLYRVILGVGSVALLVPIALLIGIVSQLGAAARRERYATVRLIGAGRKAMATLSALEMGVASLIGGVVGVGVAAALRPAAALMQLNGTQSYEADLAPSLWWVVASVLGMTVLGAGTAWWRAFRDEHGALGATRERAEKPATWRRAIVLVVGLAVFTASAVLAAKSTGGGAILLLGLVGGFAAVAFGIVLGGLLADQSGESGIRSRSARSAPSLVAAGRLSRHPRATFRSVAGVVVAVFIVSALAGIVSSVNRVATATNEPGPATTQCGRSDARQVVGSRGHGVGGECDRRRSAHDHRLRRRPPGTCRGDRRRGEGSRRGGRTRLALRGDRPLPDAQRGYGLRRHAQTRRGTRPRWRRRGVRRGPDEWQ